MAVRCSPASNHQFEPAWPVLLDVRDISSNAVRHDERPGSSGQALRNTIEEVQVHRVHVPAIYVDSLLMRLSALRRFAHFSVTPPELP
jgi:hypothetical protein